MLNKKITNSTYETSPERKDLITPSLAKTINGALIVCILGTATIISIAKYNSRHQTSTIPQTSTQTQAPHGLSLQTLIKENSGAMESIGTDQKETRRKDFDNDSVYDFQQVCSNGRIFYLSSSNVNAGKNECWYPVQAQGAQTQ